MKNKTFKKSSKNKKTKLNRRKRTRKTKKRTRRLKGKGPAFSRSAPPGPPTANFSVGPHWVKKANVQNDKCSLCLEPLRNNGRKYVVYELPCGHQFHAYCLHELCDNIENTGVNINGSVSIPCPICRALFNPDHHCHDVLGFTKSQTYLVPEPIMRTLESRDYVFHENDETSGN